MDGFQPVGERETLDPFRRGGGFVPDPGAGEHRRDRRDRPEATHDHGFLACDIRDVLPKDDLGSMEHPFFSLSTRPDRAIRRYEHKGNRIEIAPGARGMATIWDKDILIYCISQLAEALNLGRAVSQTVRVTAHDILVATGRQTSGEGYRALKAALERLSGTRITTNIETNGTRTTEGFGLIDHWKIVEALPGNHRVAAIEITLSDWLYNAVLGREVLTLSRDYFQLRKGLERRLYEIARKHCGKQTSWKIGLAALHKKSGSGGALKELRRKVKAIAEAGRIPDYRLVYEAGADRVVFYPRTPRGALREAKDLLGRPPSLQSLEPKDTTIRYE